MRRSQVRRVYVAANFRQRAHWKKSCLDLCLHDLAQRWHIMDMSRVNLLGDPSIPQRMSPCVPAHWRYSEIAGDAQRYGDIVKRAKISIE